MKHARARSWRAVIAGPAFLCAALGACDKDTVAPPAPGITLSTPMPSLSLTQGDRTSVGLTVTRLAGFSGPVTLGITGAPADITADIADNPVTGNSATIDIVLGDGVAPGSYHLTVTATGADISPEAITLELQVAARAPVSVSVAYCAGAEPMWAAFQDGSGAWVLATPDVSGGVTAFHRVFATNRGAVATVTSLFDGAFRLLRVMYGAPAELAAMGDTNPADCTTPESKTLLGEVAGLDANESARISYGPAVFATAVPQRTEFTLVGLPAGPHDLLAARTTLTNNNLPVVTGLILRRNVDLPDGAELQRLDFSSAEAFAPASANVTLTGFSPDGAISHTELLTGNSKHLLPVFTAPELTRAAVRPYFAVPESRLQPGDLQLLSGSSNLPGGAGLIAELYFRSPVDRTLSFGAPIGAPVISAVATAPSLRLRATFAPQADYDRLTSMTYLQASNPVIVSVSMTPAYAAATGAGYALVIPDLSAATGFDPAWTLRPDMSVSWVANRSGGTLPISGMPFDGATRRTATLSDVFTVR